MTLAPTDCDAVDGFALLLRIAYVEGMAKAKIDPFVSTEPEVELERETSRILDERIKSADAGRLVSAEEARQRIPIDPLNRERLALRSRQIYPLP
jgi:hypothetical protein